MPEIGFTNPWWLTLLPMALMPFIRPGQNRHPYPGLIILPEDKTSARIQTAQRLLASLLLMALVLAITDPFLKSQTIEKTGFGAHIALAIDRSSSMNENFSGQYLGGNAHETKSAAARKILLEFVTRRKEDLYAVTSFSTAPAHVLSLTDDREAVKAAIRAIGLRGSGNTNIAPGLAMALEQFRDKPISGARVILLVSDGAAQIDPDVQDRLRQDFQDLNVRLYWIYLRNPRGVSLFNPPKRNLSETTAPEFFIHQYFQSLGVPYHAFEADNPRALAEAVAEVGQLENQPLQYQQHLPRRPLAQFGYGLAFILGLPLVLLKALEISQWPG